jgi:hypothetical protein
LCIALARYTATQILEDFKKSEVLLKEILNQMFQKFQAA